MSAIERATKALERYAEIQAWYRNTVADNEGQDLRPEEYEAYDDERLQLLEEVIDILDQLVNG